MGSGNPEIKNTYVALIIVIIPIFLASFSPSVKVLPDFKKVVLNKTIWFPGSIIHADDVSGNIESVVIPLKRVGKLFLIEARIDNETGNFIFDTGASQLVLNITYFRQYFTVEGESGGITGSSGDLKRTIVKNIQIPGLQFKNITANLTDLGHLENRRGVKILGLFGLTLMKDMEIVIDFNRNELYLYNLDKTGNRLNKRDSEFRYDLVHKIDVYHDVMFAKGTLGGKILNFCLDTGAESNVISSTAPKNVLSSLTILQRTNLKGVGKAQSEVLLCSLDDLSLGSQHFPGMNAIIANLDDLSAFYGYSIDGMLGFDFFEQGKVSVNMKKKELKLCFNKPAVN